MTRRPSRKRQKSRRERLYWSIAAVIIILSAMTYWYDGGEDEMLDGKRAKGAVSSSSRRRSEQCRTSCEDVIVSAARGGIVESPQYNDGLNTSPEALASSAVDALFHWQATDETNEENASSSKGPYEQQRYDDFALYPFRRAVYSYMYKRQFGASASSSSSSGTQTQLAPPPPSRLPPLIEALVGAVDSRYQGGRIRGGSGYEHGDNSESDGQSLIRMTKTQALQRSALGGISASDMPNVVKNGEDEQAVAMAAAAAAATFWSSRAAHWIVGRHRMKSLNEEWDASLRWIAGWGQDQLNANSRAGAAATSARDTTKRERRRNNNGVGTKSKAAKDCGLDGLTAEEESELLVLIDVCVDECIGMTGGTNDQRSNRDRSLSSTPTRHDDGLGVGGNMLLTLISALTGKVASDRLIPSHQHYRVVWAGVVRLVFSSIVVLCLRTALKWFVSSSFWPLSQQRGREEGQSWIDEDKVHGIGRGSKKKTGGGKKGKRKKVKPATSTTSDNLTPQKLTEEVPESRSGAQAIGRSATPAGELARSTSQNSLTDEDDDAILGLVRPTRLANIKTVESPISSANSLASTPNDTPVHSPTRGKHSARRNKKAERSQKGHAAAPQYDRAQSKSISRRMKKQEKKLKRNEATVAEGASQPKPPVPTEAQRFAATQQLREFQRIQIGKIAQRKKAAALAAERATAGTKLTGTVSYSSAVVAGSPPLSPPLSQQCTPNLSAVSSDTHERMIEKLRLDSDTQKVSAPPATSIGPPPGLDIPVIRAPGFGVVSTPLDAMAGELLLSGMLEEDEDEDDMGQGQESVAVASGPCGFGNITTNVMAAGGVSPWNSNNVPGTSSSVVPVGGASAAGGNSAWSSESHQSQGVGGNAGGIW